MKKKWPTHDHLPEPAFVRANPELKLLTIPEVARILRQSPRTIRRWLAMDPPRLPFIQIGQQKKVRLIDLTNYMSKARHAPIITMGGRDDSSATC